MAGTKDNAERSAAQIEADITKTRERLAKDLDELAMRVHPSTIVAQGEARLMASIEQKAGQACSSVNDALRRVTAPFTDEQGRPRLERIIPAALVGVGVVLLYGSFRKRNKD